MKKYFKIFNGTLFFLIMISIPVIFLSGIKNSIKALESNDLKIIYIDPGHGGIDGGGMAISGVYEKEINLKVAYYLKTFLENSGYNVLLTRYGDYDLASPNSKNRKAEDIKKRVSLINDDKTILYISLHCNIYLNNSIYGAQTFYNDNNLSNKILAENIQSKFQTILKNTNRKSKKIKEKYLVDNAIKDGCLVELGFLSNEKEYNLLISNEYQEKLAYCIYIGIIEYLGVNNNL